MTEDRSVPRLTPIVDTTALTPEQRELWESVAGGARATTAVRPEGQLTGPFDVLLRSPELGRAVSDLGALLRFSTTLGDRITEVVILTVAGRWQARYAWLRHAIYAERERIPAAAVDAIAEGRVPEFDDPRDRAAAAVASALVTDGQVPDDVYAEALEVLGERTLVEVVALTGYYCLSSFLLNAFRVPLPPGASVPWDPTVASQTTEKEETK
jgi:4-carboxymuconolactone decarboxylase